MARRGDAKLAKTLDAHAAWVRSGGREGERADLAGSDLRGRNLVGGLLARANLAGADLREANLGWADLREADLGGADLRGATLAHTVGSNPIDLPRGDYRVNLTGARLDGANVAGLDLWGTGAPGTGSWIGPNDAEQCMKPPPLPPLVDAGEAVAPPAAAPPEKPEKPRRKKASARKARGTDPPEPAPAPASPGPTPPAPPAAAATLLGATLPPGRALGLRDAWHLALAIARAFDPSWPASPELVAKSEEVDWKEGVLRIFADGPEPKYVHAWHWTATDPHLGGGGEVETIGAAVYGLDVGRPTVTVVPRRRSWEGDRVRLDLECFRWDCRAQARAVAEASLGVAFEK